jgi:hypothetical protein
MLVYYFQKKFESPVPSYYGINRAWSSTSYFIVYVNSIIFYFSHFIKYSNGLFFNFFKKNTLAIFSTESFFFFFFYKNLSINSA